MLWLRRVLAALVAIVAGLAPMSAAAAGGFHGRPATAHSGGHMGGHAGFHSVGGHFGSRPAGGHVGSRPVGGHAGFRPVTGHPGAPHRFGQFHHSGPRPFVRTIVVGFPFVGHVPPLWYGSSLAYDPAPYGYAPPAYGYAPSPYDAPAAVYAPPRATTVSLAPSPPPPPSTPGTVEFPTGRYELRGDGTTVPYTWVWIPNPPPPPSAPPEQGNALADAPAPRVRQPYRWTDEQGVVHWTDRLDAVPPQYRAQARPLAR